MRTILLTTAAVLIHISVIEGWRPYYVNARNVSYVVAHPDIVDFLVNIRTSDNIQYFSGYLNILQVIYDGFIHLTILFDSGNEIFDLIYINKTLNICELLANIKLNVFMNIAYKLLSEFVDVPRRCPIPKKFYKVDNATFNVETLPPFMPDKKMLIQSKSWIVRNGRKIMIAEGSGIASIERKFKRKI